MKRTVFCACVLVVALGWFVGDAFSSGRGGDRIGDIWISISPSTFVIGRDQGDDVTVHTNIQLSVVDCASVALGGVPVSWTKADTRGCLVAKFDPAAIEAIIAPPKATLVLTGVTIDGEPFSGEDTIRVIIDPAPEE